MPDPITVPMRVGSTSGLPASAHASRAATSATCWERSSLRASTRSSGGSSASVPAKCTVMSDTHSSVSGRMPERPASNADQLPGTSPARGVVAPRPVIAMRIGQAVDFSM